MDEERSTDTQETFGSQEPPSSVSNQNTEEDSTPSAGDAKPPNRDDRDPAEEDTGREDRAGESGRPGGAGEHSQATGHPLNAG